MSADAEKVINLSLCKMAESRGIRRGGSSLHKHLLIASVLTKARSAYFENWYLGDNDCSSVNGNDGLPESSSGANDQAALNQILDPSFFVEVEASEIELPSDILNCVEKLGDMTDLHMGFSVNGGVDLNARIRDEVDMIGVTESDEVTSSTSDMIQGETESEKPRTESEMSYTYLDLDSSKKVPQSSTNVPVPTNSLPSLFSGISSSPPAPQSTSKRRREWSFELDDDSDDEDEDVPCSASPELKAKLKLQGAQARSIHHISKRLRSSVSSNSTNSNESFCSNSTSSQPLTFPSYNFEGNNFRTKKPHFDVDEQEDASGTADGASFDDDDEDGWFEGKSKSSERNDRRVPSASSSGSSDEEQDLGCSMEVDQITSLVQYFSFQKQQQENVAPAGMANNNNTNKNNLSSSPPSQLPSLSRSMSTPDLCSRSGSNTSSSGNSISCPKSKDLFSSYGLASSHRVLTMKV